MDNQSSVREDRAALTQLALEGGLNPLKAAEFGSKVADAFRQMRDDPDNKGCPSMLAAVFRDATGQLSGVMLDVNNDASVKQSLQQGALRVEDSSLKAFSKDMVETKPEDVRNYSFMVHKVHGGPGCP